MVESGSDPDTLDTSSLRALVRDVPDFPQAGIVFRDITPLLGNGAALRSAVDALAALYQEIDSVIGIESRGFILGAPVAYALGVGMVPVRKLGRLPRATERADYALEYGTNTVEIHADALRPGERVLIVDDVLATGGTAAATAELVERLGGQVAGIAVLIELPRTSADASDWRATTSPAFCSIDRMSRRRIIRQLPALRRNSLPTPLAIFIAAREMNSSRQERSESGPAERAGAMVRCIL